MKFEHPKYISTEGIDTLKISFNNTSEFLTPLSDDLTNIPNGYTLIVKLPPQSEDLMTEDELQQVQRNANTVIISELIVSILFNSVLSTLLGSILVLQILAHLSLANIYLPANLLQTFKLLISFISFDFFLPFEYIEVDFTEVGSWSPNFDWLGYDTVNFLEVIGSIAIIAAIQLLRVLISLMLKTCERKCRSWKCCEQIFSGSAVWMSSLTFINATFFEIVVCASIAMSMLPYVNHLT